MFCKFSPDINARQDRTNSRKLAATIQARKITYALYSISIHFASVNSQLAHSGTSLMRCWRRRSGRVGIWLKAVDEYNEHGPSSCAKENLRQYGLLSYSIGYATEKHWIRRLVGV